MAATSSCSISRHNGVGNEDKISNLPDDVISSILSLLPTKYAVATSILSRRWRFLWTSISNVDFDDELLIHSQETYMDNFLEDGRKSDIIVGKWCFIHFVNKVLFLLNSKCIQKFRLSCSDKLCDRFHVNDWICAAIACNVQELDLSVFLNRSIELPRSLFTCKTIVDLKLTGKHINFNIPVGSVFLPNLKVLHLIKAKCAFDETVCKVSPDSLCFPNLKTLRFVSVKYVPKEYIGKIFYSCPVLEDIIIKRTFLEGVSTFTIYGPGLRSLDYKSVIDHGKHWYKVMINAHELEDLNMAVHEPEGLLAENLFLFPTATVEFDVCGFHKVECPTPFKVSKFLYSGCGFNYNLIEILKRVHYATFLSLQGYTMKLLSLVLKHVSPMFCKLNQLEIRFTNSDWHLLPSFLENSECLEHFVCIKKKILT